MSSDENVVPLSFGQASAGVWRGPVGSISMDSDVRAVFRIGRSLSRVDCSRAFGDVIKSLPGLRTHIDSGEHCMTQRILLGSEGHVPESLDGSYHRLGGVSVGWGWREVSAADEDRWVEVFAHPIIADRAALQLVAGQVGEQLGRQSPGPVSISRLSPCQLALRQRSAPFYQSEESRVRAYFERVFMGVLRGPGAPVPKPTRGVAVAVESDELLGQMRRISRTVGVSVASTFVALASCLYQAKLGGSQRVDLIAANRLNRLLQGYVGTVSQGVPMLAPSWQSRSNPGAFLTETWAASMVAYRHGIYDPAWLVRVEAETEPFGGVVVNVISDRDRPRRGNRVRDVASGSASSDAFRFTVTYGPLAESVRLVLWVSECLLRGGDIRELVRTMFLQVDEWESWARENRPS